MTWCASRKNSVARCLAWGLLIVLCLPIWAWAAEVMVTGDDTPAIRSFVDALAAKRSEDNVLFRPLGQVPPAQQLPAQIQLITLGKNALQWRLSSRQGPPTLALLVSRVEAQQLLDGQHPQGVALLWSDPPLERQLRLIKLVLPNAKRIGVPYDERSAFLIGEARSAAATLGLTIVAQPWHAPRDTETLNQLLRTTDALLGLDDRELYNPRTAKTLLLTSYGQNRALFGPSAAFVKAGSLASTYSDQNNWLAVLDELLDRPATQWPRAAYPEHFKVAGNRQVARALGLKLPEDDQLARQLAGDRGR